MAILSTLMYGHKHTTNLCTAVRHHPFSSYSLPLHKTYFGKGVMQMQGFPQGARRTLHTFAST